MYLHVHYDGKFFFFRCWNLRLQNSRLIRTDFRTCLWKRNYVYANVINVNLHIFARSVWPCSKIEKHLLEDHFKPEQRTRLRIGFLNRKCPCYIVVFGLIEAEFWSGCVLQSHSISQICCTSWSCFVFLVRTLKTIKWLGVCWSMEPRLLCK